MHKSIKGSIDQLINWTIDIKPIGRIKVTLSFDQYDVQLNEPVTGKIKQLTYAS